jgi:CRISPR-associated protein Cas5t
MNTLRLRLYQETACYKKPAAFKVGETYPLPPYSTVKGMLHQALQADRYIPMRLSIQGRYESRIVDYQRHYFFKTDKSSEFPLVLDGLALDYEFQTMSTMPLYMHMLLHVELVVHVQAEDDVLERIERAVVREPLSLGRWEDLVRVDECKRVDCAAADNDDLETVMPIYIPASLSEDVSGVPYRLNWKYEIVQGVRQWSKIKVRYVPAGEWIGDLDIRCDEDGFPVAIPSEMEE